MQAFLVTLRSQHGPFQIRDTAYPARMAATWTTMSAFSGLWSTDASTMPPRP